MMHKINITTFLKVISSENLSSVSIKFSVLPNFSMPIIHLTLTNTPLAYNYQLSNILSFMFFNLSH